MKRTATVTVLLMSLRLTGVDLSTPSKLVVVGSYRTASPARDVAVAGSMVFVIVASGEVVILREGQ